jgi:hypothetical protein
MTETALPTMAVVTDFHKKETYRDIVLSIHRRGQYLCRSPRRAVMTTLQLLYECWLEITKQKRYHDKWLMGEMYYQAIKAQFPTVESLGFD